MNRRELIRILSERTNLTQARAADVVNALFDAVEGIIPEKLRAGERVQIPGFGTFTRKDRPERSGLNPRTGAEITIAASSAPSFKPGRGLRDAILGEPPERGPVMRGRRGPRGTTSTGPRNAGPPRGGRGGAGPMR